MRASYRVRFSSLSGRCASGTVPTGLAASRHFFVLRLMEGWDG